VLCHFLLGFVNKNKKIAYTGVFCIFTINCVKGPTTKLGYEAFDGLSCKVSLSRMASPMIFHLRLLISVWS